jgi:hypothetical protein
MVTFGNGSKVGGHHQSTMNTMEPSPEQVGAWIAEAHNNGIFSGTGMAIKVIGLAYAEGSDEQLRLCVEHLKANGWMQVATALQNAMRPKPLSLKRQALEDLESMAVQPCIIRTSVDEYKDLNEDLHAKYLRIRRAIESIPGD